MTKHGIIFQINVEVFNQPHHACLLKQIALRFFDKVYEGEIEVYSNITESPLPNNFMAGWNMSYGSNTRMQTKTKRFQNKMNIENSECKRCEDDYDRQLWREY